MIPRDHNIQLRIGDLLARNLAAANLLGRMHVQREARIKSGRAAPLAMSSRFAPLDLSGHPRFAEDSQDAGVDPAADAAALAGVGFNLPQTGAVDYIRSLTPVTRSTFDGLSAQYKRDAFTIAGTSDVRLIERVRDELAKVVGDGGTPKDFQAAIDQLTTDAGVEKINAFTLDTAFQTAVQRAYSLGRYEQLTEESTMAVLPYWQYMTAGDDRVRPEHAVIDFFVARATDPVWRKIYPPNGFNCRCIVVALLASEAPKDADESGLLRLPLLAQMKVPQAGFGKVFRVAA